MKIAPIQRVMTATNWCEPILVHTGQHYDEAMSKIFFEDLEMPHPDYFLGVGSGTHAQQTAAIMVKLEEIVQRISPELILVVGDVNSTLAASIVAAKLQIPIAHVEAGLRSFDRHMPEEINRILTDAVSDYLFITEESGKINLLKEGVDPQKIHFVGNVMIDSLFHCEAKADRSKILDQLNLDHTPFALLTLHRPSNVDFRQTFVEIIDALDDIQRRIQIIFPIHPRTRKMIDQFGLSGRLQTMRNFRLIDPLGYLEFLKLMKNASFVLTDSGGIQEETTALSIPCLTLRENTERPSTVKVGTNILVGMNSELIRRHSFDIINGEAKTGTIPPLWDGKAALRIVSVLKEHMSPSKEKLMGQFDGR